MTKIMWKDSTEVGKKDCFEDPLKPFPVLFLS